MFTRRDYLKGHCSYDEYYLQFLNPALVDFIRKKIGTETILKTNNLNDIPLHVWDELIFHIKALIQSDVIIETQEGWSIATGVCVAKRAAKFIKDAHNAN